MSGMTRVRGIPRIKKEAHISSYSDSPRKGTEVHGIL